MNVEAHEDDPFGFIIEEYKISLSQEELLRNTPLVGDYSYQPPILPSLTPPLPPPVPSLTPLLHHCTLNLASDIDDHFHCFVDLTQDSDLGFSHPHPNHNGIEQPLQENHNNLQTQQPSPMSELIRFLLDKATQSGNDHFSVFDVLQFLAIKRSGTEVPVQLNGLSVLEVAKLAHITFPRPRWWPHHFQSKLFNFHD
uniref:Uncharacterized protein LOC101499176 n=1 Tax=Cicer arietinum TaxID=3827 RepID=A0A1S2Y7U7_CICAR|nr:uncharacterized protein LOC101499176 [Cicer arietinum]